MVNSYGEWPSPISADRVASDTLAFGGVAVDDSVSYWLERRPEDGGRGVICRQDQDTISELTPEDVNVRTTVHEYGGGDFAVQDGTLVYSRFEDQRLYRTTGDSPEPITPEPPEKRSHRYADMVFSPDGSRVYCVRERHDTAETEPKNELVVVSLGDAKEPTVVAEGHDFYSFPQVAESGDRLAWTTWDHPQMPWDGTELHVGDIDADGTVSNEQTLIGGPEESVFQPAWGPDGQLYAVSDRTGWWNLYQIEDGEPRNIHEEEAEYGSPQWSADAATYSVLADGTILAIRNQNGSHDLVWLDPETGERETTGLPYDVYPHPRIATDGRTVVTVAAGPATPPSVIEWTPKEDATLLRQSFSLDLDPDMLSEPTHITFPSGEEHAHGLYYPPQHPDAEPPPEQTPPLVVTVHGGPTGQTMPVVDLSIQYFTSRGIGVFDLNYRGSTGYGREYRDRLEENWGVLDTLDCVNAAKYLTQEGKADPDRLAIRGKSAGGYAALCALAFHETFDAGVSYYGIGDLRALAEHTHKFESRYLDGLVGPLPEAEQTYIDRSPAEHAEQITAPLLVLQGGDDRVVPPEQADTLVSALVESETPYAYLTFPEQRHGFRTAHARKTALEAELRFYSSVFAFDPADELSALDLSDGVFEKQIVENDG